MRRSRHAAEDGSFGRSAGIAVGRGAALLAVAVVLGIVLLNAADDAPPEEVSAGSSEEESTPTTPTLPITTTPTVPLRAPQDVKVLSANGTTVKGVAGKARDQLKAAGYNVLAPTDAQKADVSAVYFTAPDFEREAQAVAGVLGLPPTSVQAYPAPAPIPDARGSNVVVVVGAELAQRLSAAPAAPAAGGPTTTTAAARGASTTAP